MEQIRIWGAQLATSFRGAIGELISFMPGVLLALVLIVVGWILAQVLRRITANLVGRVSWLFLSAGTSSTEAAAKLKKATVHAASVLVFWAVLLSFIGAALRSLGSPLVEDWTRQFFEYLPVFVGGALIILVGFIGGALAREIVESAASGADLANSGLVGRIIQISIVVAGIVIGAGHLGLDVSFLGQLVVVTVGVSLAGLALATALGTREHLANLVGARYLRKYYQVGDKIRVGEREGRILQIADGCVFLESDDGDVSVPGAFFSKSMFFRLDSGDGP